MSVLLPSLIKLKQELARSQGKEAAWAIVEHYFAFYNTEATKEELWTLLAACLTNNEVGENASSRYRHDKIFFYEFTLMFMEAVALLDEKKRRKRTSRK